MVAELESYMLPCFSKKYLGFECMGCGLQRSLAFLVEGEFVAAFNMYPAIYSLLALAGVITVNVFIKIKYATQIISALAALSVAIIIINYIFKMTTN